MLVPKVSICIPAYNNVNEVKRLLESIFLQSFKNYEIILTDDSTNNEISELIEQMGRQKIRYIHNPKPLGHIFNWNRALSEAKGEYIKIMFSDDWFTSSDSLEKWRLYWTTGRRRLWLFAVRCRYLWIVRKIKALMHVALRNGISIG